MSLGDYKGANKIFYICNKLRESGVKLDGDYIITQRKKKLKYTNENLKYCIEKLFYSLKYEAEEDEVSDMIIDFKYIFDNELEEEEEEEEADLDSAHDQDFLDNKLKHLMADLNEKWCKEEEEEEEEEEDGVAIYKDNMQPLLDAMLND